ncbi:hypothetical protein SIID45300_01671 [Candidatus Magnetaquicoccaceae bacterium FCR-1]|uniref:Bacteriophage CI repressor N-terminal domain-containing protein n=1 Tax=Candidatus Magnetaquiglobus chichijimensis TaxID=3141448 RepID=A0ABQ0C8X7_9PROT
MKKTFPPILARICEHLNLNKNQDIASALGVAQPTVINWGERNDIPLDRAVEFSKRERISLDWLITGEGPKYKSEGLTPTIPATTSPDETALLDAYRAADEAGRAALLITAKAMARKA